MYTLFISVNIGVFVLMHEWEACAGRVRGRVWSVGGMCVRGRRRDVCARVCAGFARERSLLSNTGMRHFHALGTLL